MFEVVKKGGWANKNVQRIHLVAKLSSQKERKSLQRKGEEPADKQLDVSLKMIPFTGKLQVVQTSETKFSNPLKPPSDLNKGSLHQRRIICSLAKGLLKLRWRFLLLLVNDILLNLWPSMKVKWWHNFCASQIPMNSFLNPLGVSYWLMSSTVK